MAYQLNVPDHGNKNFRETEKFIWDNENLSCSSKDGSRQYQYDYRKSVGKHRCYIHKLKKTIHTPP